MQLHMFWALYIHAADAQDVRRTGRSRRGLGRPARLRELIWESPSARRPRAPPRPELDKTLEDYCTRGAYDEFWPNDYGALGRAR